MSDLAAMTQSPSGDASISPVTMGQLLPAIRSAWPIIQDLHERKIEIIGA